MELQEKGGCHRAVQFAVPVAGIHHDVIQELWDQGEGWLGDAVAFYAALFCRTHARLTQSLLAHQCGPQALQTGGSELCCPLQLEHWEMHRWLPLWPQVQGAGAEWQM